jgi:hypothetical protein
VPCPNQAAGRASLRAIAVVRPAPAALTRPWRMPRIADITRNDRAVTHHAREESGRPHQLLQERGAGARGGGRVGRADFRKFDHTTF